METVKYMRDCTTGNYVILAREISTSNSLKYQSWDELHREWRDDLDADAPFWGEDFDYKPITEEEAQKLIDGVKNARSS